MSKAGVIVSAVILEGRSKTEVAREYGVARSWVYTLADRYLAGGWDAIEPRSKRPASNPRQISAELETEIVQSRCGCRKSAPQRRGVCFRYPARICNIERPDTQGTDSILIG